MPTLSQIPGRLDIVLTKGDSWSANLDFDVETVSWTLSATIDTDTPTSFTLANATGGVVTLSLTSGETNALPVGQYTWHLDRSDTGYEREYIAGYLTVILHIP